MLLLCPLLLHVAAVVQATTTGEKTNTQPKEQQPYRLNEIINGQHTKMQFSQGKQEQHERSTGATPATPATRATWATHRSNMSWPGATSMWLPRKREDARQINK